MNNFIIKDDFKAIATEIDLQVLSNDNDLIINQCNQIAIDEAAGYLNTKYNLPKLFLDPVLYDVAKANVVGDRVYTVTQPVDIDVYTHYSCIQDAPIGTLITDTAYYTLGDTRDMKLLQVVMTISLFYVHMRLTPNNIPTFRVIAYDGSGSPTDVKEVMSAIKWLTMIQKGTLNPYNWSEKTDENIGGLNEPYEMEGADPSKGIMWGNDMGDEFHWYNQYPDPNIINTNEA